MQFEIINGKNIYIEHYRYEGAIWFMENIDESAQRKLVLFCARKLPGFECMRSHINIDYDGKDTGRHITRSLAEIASIVKQSDSTIRCYLFTNGGELTFIEKFTVSNGLLNKEIYKLQQIERFSIDFNVDFDCDYKLIIKYCSLPRSPGRRPSFLETRRFTTGLWGGAQRRV